MQNEFTNLQNIQSPSGFLMETLFLIFFTALLFSTIFRATTSALLKFRNAAQQRFVQGLMELSPLSVVQLKIANHFAVKVFSHWQPFCKRFVERFLTIGK